MESFDGTEKTLRCSACNAQVDNNSAFCPKCGERITCDNSNDDKEIQKIAIKTNSAKKYKIVKALGAAFLCIFMICGFLFFQNQIYIKKSEAAYQIVYSQFLNATFFGDIIKASDDLTDFKDIYPDFEINDSLTELCDASKAFVSAVDSEIKYSAYIQKLEDLSKVVPDDLQSTIATLKERANVNFASYKQKENSRLANEFYKYINECPLQMNRYYNMQYNIIGTPEVSVWADNTGSKIIDSMEIYFYLFNNYNEPITKYNSGYYNNLFIGVANNIIRPGGSLREYSGYWTLYGYDLATKSVEFVKRLHFTDGTTWEIPDKYFEKIVPEIAAERVKLR